MKNDTSRARAIGRRSALMLPLAGLAGCSALSNIGDLFGKYKPPIPGTRESVLQSERGLLVGASPPGVTLPHPVANANWPQQGGNPAHLMGHLAAAPNLAPAWRASIGAGSGFRRRITSQPVVLNGLVFTMDSEAYVTAFDAKNGDRVWEFNTRAKKSRSTNIGGGIGADGNVLYAATGRGDLIALDAAKGTVRWRKNIGVPARSSPTIADGRIFLTDIEQKLQAFAADDGRALWQHQASVAPTVLLESPAPAYSDGFVVAGFGSGDLVAIRVETGAVIWTDSIAATSQGTSFADVSAITGLPVIDNGRVYVAGLGGLLASIDLRTGRHIWEHTVAGGQSPWVAGDWIFVITDQQQIAAVQKIDGATAWVADLPRWKNEVEHKNPLFWFGPLLASDRLVVAGSEPEALAISPYTGRVIGRQKLSDGAAEAPILAAGTLYIVTTDGSLLALR